MTNYREILRLQNLGFNQAEIAKAMGITRQTASGGKYRLTRNIASNRTAKFVDKLSNLITKNEDNYKKRRERLENNTNRG